MVLPRRVCLASILAAALVTACAYHSWSERHDVSIPAGAHWAWAPLRSANASEKTPPLSVLGDSAVVELLRGAQSAMNARGYREVVDTAQAEFLLVVGTGDHNRYAPVVHDGLGGPIAVPAFRVPMYVNCSDYLGGVCPTGWGGPADPGAPVSLYAPCQAPWETCVMIGLWRKDGRLAWRAAYAMDADALERATPADMRHVARMLFGDLP